MRRVKAMAWHQDLIPTANNRKFTLLKSFFACAYAYARGNAKKRLDAIDLFGYSLSFHKPSP